MGITNVLGFGLKIIDKVVPDKAEAERLKLETIRLSQEGELKELETQMQAIVMEAQSKDPWTSRARPGFLYVMYILVLAAIPMGILSAFNPAMAAAIAHGFNAWLAAIPQEMWTLFGIGYLGYVGGRSWDKHTVVKAKGKL